MVHAITLLLSAHVAASKNVSASSNFSFIRAMQPYMRRLGREKKSETIVDQEETGWLQNAVSGAFRKKQNTDDGSQTDLIFNNLNHPLVSLYFVAISLMLY